MDTRPFELMKSSTAESTHAGSSLPATSECGAASDAASDAEEREFRALVERVNAARAVF